MSETVVRHIKRYDQLKRQRSNWESSWQDVLDHVVPRKADITRFQSPGLLRGEELFDGTAEHSNEVLAGALHSMLTNPSAQWFELTTGDAKSDSEDDIREFLDESAKRMHNVLNNSNFQTEVHEIYIDLGSVGTACLFMEEDNDKVIRFSARFMGEIYIAENRYGFIDTVYRCYRYTHRQAAQEWPDNAKLKELADKKPDECVDILHCVYPRSERNYKKVNSGNMPWASEYIWVEERVRLSEGGYRVFPYAVPRWTKATGEVYGRSPSMKALPDIKMLQEIMSTYLEALQKAVDPPMIAPDDGVLLPLDTTPGGLNYKRAGMGDEIKPLMSGTEFPLAREELKELRERIRAHYYIDQLQLSQGPQMTATEVLQRTEEKMRLIGPVLGRQESEFLRPLIDRLFDIMYRRKLLPEVPAALRGKKIDVKYTSIVAKSQRVQEGQNMLRAFQLAGAFGQIDPSIWHNINGDEWLRFAFNLHGAPTRVLNKARDVKKRRDEESEAKAQQAKAMSMAQGAENMKNLAPVLEAVSARENGTREAG